MLIRAPFARSGAVGEIAILYNETGAAIAPGATVSGAGLRRSTSTGASGLEARIDASGPLQAVSGQWRNLGGGVREKETVIDPDTLNPSGFFIFASLFQRVA